MDARRRRVVAGTLGAALGVLAAAGLLAATSRAIVEAARTAPPRVEATHLPPLLTLPGEAVTLRYDVYCVAADAPAASCDADGVVYARAGDAGPFEALPLRLDPAAVEGRYFVRVPDVLAWSGFSYYALLHDRTSGASTTLPSGAPEALERSAPMGAAAVVQLGRHTFGTSRAADARVVSARWGDGPDDVGLEERGPDATPIGASSFDVDSSGRVTVLDEAHRRLLRWAPDGSRRPEKVPVAVRGTIGDIATGSDGTTYVVETAAAASSALMRAFAADGHQLSAVDVGQSGDTVRVGPDGPVVLEPQTGRWFGPGRPAGAGYVGRPVGGSLRVVVYRPDPGELRLALVAESGTVARAWRIESSTPMGEVQLAEPLSGKLVAVVRVYEERRAEFVALVLGPGGVRSEFSVDAADWAEAAPLARFRLVGGSLYRLGSTPAGVFVDRYDLGVS